jgi:hypothetical protein
MMTTDLQKFLSGRLKILVVLFLQEKTGLVGVIDRTMKVQEVLV